MAATYLLFKRYFICLNERGGERHMQRTAEWLTERDWQIVETVYWLRLMSGSQIERLYFQSLSGRARNVVRGRVLRRLVAWKMLAVLPRRVGGAMRGSSGSVLALGATGRQLCAARQPATTTAAPVRPSDLPGAWQIQHTLTVSETYVGLIEQSRVQGVQVIAFAAVPASWWPNGLRGFLKPDAYACLSLGNVREHWWVEVDLGTESLPALKRKLLAYLDFVERGQLGPNGVVPRVLLSLTTQARCEAVRMLISQLPAPAADLFVALVDHETTAYLIRSVLE
jgi:hypothetical protein